MTYKNRKKGETQGSRPYRIRWHDIVCPVCGETTKLTGDQANRRDLKTCGRPACTSEQLRRSNGDRMRRLNAEFEPVRSAAVAASPLSGKFETNASAVEWSLLSPDGTAYRFRNLALWLREHADLFDPADVEEKRNARGIVSTNAQGQLGKLRPERRERKQSWKGWKWLETT